MNIINQKELKRMFESKEIKIGNDVSRAFSEKQRKILRVEVERVVRNVRIAGRKVVKKADFN